MNLALTQRAKVSPRRGTSTICDRCADSLGRLEVREDFRGQRFFRVESRVGGKAVDSNRDEDVALENVQHCHAGLVWAEDGFIAKAVDTSRFAVIGGENRKHCLSEMRRGFLARI